MRDLFKVVAWLKDEAMMEYCEEFNGIKSILEYINENVKPFDKICFRAGHEPIIKEIVRRLEGLLEDCETTKKEGVLRKIVMFLVLNTNVSFKYNLKDNPNISHVVNICPLIPACILVPVIWSLKLDEYFYELLTYTPCWFSFQFFEPSTDSLKYILNPFDVLDKVEKLLKAIIISISNTQFTEADLINIKTISNKLCDYSMNLMRQFYTTDAEKFKKFTKKQHYKYSGYALKHLLRLVLQAFDVYERTTDFCPTDLPQKLTIYAIFLRSTYVNRSITSMTSKITDILKKQELKIIIALLNALQTNIMLVNVDIFLYWAEVDENNQRTLQEVVGNMVYEVAERMKANPDINHDVSNQLVALAIRPLPLEEVIINSTIGDILNSLEKSGTHETTRKLWLNELINRKMALGNDECLQTIKANAILLTENHCLKFLHFIKLEFDRYCSEINTTDDKDVNSENKVNLEETGISKELLSILLTGIENLNEMVILRIICQAINLFGPEVNILMQSDLEQRLVEFLNQCNNDEMEFNQRQFLLLLVENPRLCWTKFYNSACTNQKHITPYCVAVENFKQISEHYFLPLLIKTLSTRDYLYRQHFPLLLREIYFKLYATDEKMVDFLKGILHKHVHMALDANEYECLLPIMKAMNLIIIYGESHSHKLLNFGKLTAPVLLMVAQIMDKARWDLITYSYTRDELVRECVLFTQQTSKRFLPNAHNKDRKWISSKINDTCKPFTQFYFQKYSLNINEEPLKLHRFLMREYTRDETKIRTFLLANYLRCTSKEVEWLANCEELLPHIYETLCILRTIVKSANNENAVNNYQNCLINYINIAQKYILPNIADNNANIINLEVQLLKLIATSPEAISEKIFQVFEPMLFNILRMYKGPIEAKVICKLQQIINNIINCNIKNLFLEKIEGLCNVNEASIDSTT